MTKIGGGSGKHIRKNPYDVPSRRRVPIIPARSSKVSLRKNFRENLLIRRELPDATIRRFPTETRRPSRLARDSLGFYPSTNELRRSRLGLTDYTVGRFPTRRCRFPDTIHGNFPTGKFTNGKLSLHHLDGFSWSWYKFRLCGFSAQTIG